VEIAGGTVLVVMGVLMITGAWLQLFTPVLRWYAQKGVAARTNSRRLRDLVVRSAGS
jgi:predicted metal-binding membrane protein